MHFHRGWAQLEHDRCFDKPKTKDISELKKFEVEIIQNFK